MQIYILLCALCCSLSMSAWADTAEQTVQWRTDYERVLQDASKQQKAVVLFFTGDFCRYCKELEQQALHTPEFAQTATPHFLFVKIDQPNDPRSLSPDVATQNKNLRTKYGIKTYPTLVVLNSQGQEIGRSGYRSDRGKDYAEHLLKMVRSAQNYRQQFSRLDHLNDRELEQLYRRAKQFRFEADASRILDKGLAFTSPCSFFLKEKYKLLANRGEKDTQEGKNLKQRILSSDPKNELHNHLELAIIEFEASSEACFDRDELVDIAITPLLDYLDQFGKQDKESAWRLKMMISQAFLDRDELSEALKYAKDSYQLAPLAIRPDIANTITNIQAQLCAHH